MSVPSYYPTHPKTGLALAASHSAQAYTYWLASNTAGSVLMSDTATSPMVTLSNVRSDMNELLEFPWI